MAVKPLLAGTDGSEESFRAVQWAASEAALRKLALRILYVPALPSPMTPQWAISAMQVELERQAAMQVLVTAAERAQEKAPELQISTGRLLAGPPARALAEAASEGSMLVVGSRGLGGFAALILGSVSRYVATHAPCPVVVARAERPAMHRELVVGVGDPQRSAAAVGFAFEEAALREARLLVLHAMSPSVVTVQPVSPQAETGHARPGLPEMQAEAATRLEALLAGWRKKYPQVRADWEIVHEHPGHALAGASGHAGLVVLGRRADRAPHVPGADPVLHAVLSHAQGPVATVPGD